MFFLVHARGRNPSSATPAPKDPSAQKQMVPPPSVWGGAAGIQDGPAGGCSGHLFAFSGLDGPTVEADAFVAIAKDNATLSLLFCSLLLPRVLHVRSAPGLRESVRIATNDVIVAGPKGSEFKMVWASRSLLAGFSPPGTSVELSNSAAILAADGPSCSATEITHAQTIVLCVGPTAEGAAWGLAMGRNKTEAMDLASMATCSGPGCGVQLESLIAGRLLPYEKLGDGGKFAPLLGKALSVMRVNALSAEGRIRQRWSTPDRTPHKWMWLWDSCYHSLAANHLDPLLGWEYLASVLAAAAADGAIAIERTPTTAGTKVDQTQPPLLVWAVYENWRAAVAAGVPNATINQRLAYAMPRLAAYLRWDIANRGDTTGRTPLLHWIKGTESGMDNSPRFDGGATDLLAVDFSVFLAREATLLVEIATEVGNHSEAAFWRRAASNVSSHVHSHLWDEQAGLYADRNATTARLSAVVASTALLPLWLDDLPKERLPRLLSALKDPQLFGTKVPIPSVARSESTFSTDMWRGPMWVNSNYMIALALIDRGARSEAKELIEATLGAMQDAYMRLGAIFEFYDADGTHDPRTLMRKGDPTGGVRDYHWSAALAFDMILLLRRGL
jgi:hypothetical protein